MGKWVGKARRRAKCSSRYYAEDITTGKPAGRSVDSEKSYLLGILVAAVGLGYVTRPEDTSPIVPRRYSQEKPSLGRDVVIGSPCCLAAPAAPVRSQQALVALVGWEKTADNINSSSTSLLGQDAPLPAANQREAMEFTDATKPETTDAVPKIARQVTRGKETVSCVTLLTTLLTSLKAHRPGGQIFFQRMKRSLAGSVSGREITLSLPPLHLRSQPPKAPSNKFRSQHGVPAGPKLVSDLRFASLASL